MKQSEYAYRVRQALNEATDRLDYKTQMRLDQARANALKLQRRESPATVRLPLAQPATAVGAIDGLGTGLWAWVRGAGLVAPIVALVIGFLAIADWHQDQELEYLAAIDFAVLLDEGPLDAYADKGFGVLIRQEAPPKTR
jgi:Protein of unknown function (DUF3619)